MEINKNPKASFTRYGIVKPDSNDFALSDGYLRTNAITTVTGTYTIKPSDKTIICNSSSAFTVTLPTAIIGQRFYIKNINTGSVTVDGASSDTIDGQANQVLTQWDGMDIQCYAANKWGIV